MNGQQEHEDEGFDLAQFDQDFADAPVEDREFEEVPDGKYQVIVDKVELTVAKSSGNKMLKWTLRILGPRYAGRLLWRHNVMATRENIRWLKTDLHTCGLDLVKLSELPQHLERLLDVHLEITKRTRNDSSSIYLNRRLASDEVAIGAGHEDIPF